MKEEVAPLDVFTDADIRFFAESNPGHAIGDELCCVGVVDMSALVLYLKKRLLKSVMRVKRLVAQESTT